MKKEDVHHLFNEIDTDHSGTISEKELNAHVQAGKCHTDAALIEKIRQAIKKTKTGEINLEELTDVLCG
ncbi:unnamed protein product [Calicophoron daubneyi]